MDKDATGTESGSMGEGGNPGGAWVVTATSTSILRVLDASTPTSLPTTIHRLFFNDLLSSAHYKTIIQWMLDHQHHHILQKTLLEKLRFLAQKSALSKVMLGSYQHLSKISYFHSKGVVKRRFYAYLLVKYRRSLLLSTPPSHYSHVFAIHLQECLEVVGLILTLLLPSDPLSHHLIHVCTSLQLLSNLPTPLQHYLTLHFTSLLLP